MTNKELFIKAHKMAREIKSQYPEVNYSFQFSLCLTYLKEKKDNEMVELKGTEKQVAWAEKIRAEQINNLKFSIKDFKTKGMLAFILEKMEVLLAEIEVKDSAKWWIENKNIARYVVEMAMRKEL